MATRFQGDRHMLVFDKAPGSSLDPSAEPGDNATTRVGFDLTQPLDVRGKSFKKAPFPHVDLRRFLPDREG